jgi:GNAT superfamily N-acetyltransferase
VPPTVSHDLRIVQAATPADFEEARALFSEYAAALGFKSCFRGFDGELAGLPGRYAPPDGRLLLARLDHAPAASACGGLWRLDDGVCELRRLYVRPEARGRGVGRALALALLEEARRAGYARIRLETLPIMKEALSLYPSLGFHGIEPYGTEPLAEAIYMEKDLSPPA